MTYIARAGALGPSGPPSLRSRVLRLPLASLSHGGRCSAEESLDPK